MSRCILVLLMVGILSLRSSAQPGSEEIKSGVTQAFANLSARGMSFQNNTKETLTDRKMPSAPKVVYVKESKRRTRPDGCYLAESTPVDTSTTSPQYTQKGRIWSYNTKYSFRLSSAGTNPWVLDESAIYDSPDYTELQKKARQDALASIPNSANYRNCLSIPLPRLLNHPNFKIVSLSKIDLSGDIFRMDFDVHGNDLVEGVSFDIRIVGSFDIDKNQSWSIIDRNETVHSAGVIRTTSSKFDTIKIGDIHFLKNEHQLNRVLTAGAVTRDDQIEFEHTPSLSSSIPESEFTLTAYGFPEPVGVTWQQPTPRYAWWLLGFVICVIVALICRIIVKRIQRRAGPIIA